MKRLTLPIAIILSLASWASGQTDMASRLAAAAQVGARSLVLVRCDYDGEAGKTVLSGIGVCIDAEEGVFLTLAFGAKLHPEMILDMQLVLPGPDQESVPAEFLGLRPESGVGFVRAKEKRDWREIRFSSRSDVRIGQPVVSVGLMPGDLGNTPYLGTGYVSAELRIPQSLYYVTGGRLTCIGSPVLNSSGTAIGIVSQGVYMDYTMPTSRGATTVSLKGRQESAFFMPVDEFAYVLKDIPKNGRIPRPAWMGVLDAQGISQMQATFMKLDRPAVSIGQVIPAGPAYKAGLRNGDVIVALDGKDIERLASPSIMGRNLLRKIMLMPVGRSITLTVHKAGVDKKVSMRLAEMPLLPDEALRYVNNKLGLAVREKVPLDKVLDKSPVAPLAGLVVIGVGQRTPAAGAGLKTGDLITAVNGQRVRSASNLKQIIGQSLAKEPDKNLIFMIRRGSQQPQSVVVRPPRQASELLGPLEGQK